MKVSIIVPVYNCEAYITRCVTSILQQTHTDLEIICVNDGSKDGSGKILDRMAQHDSRIRVIHQTNRGVSAARNAGVAAATGDFFTFVDADDAVAPDMYETLLSYFIAEDIDIVHCGYRRIRPDGTTKDVNGTNVTVVQTSAEAIICLLTGRLFVGSLCNKLYRSDLFKHVTSDTSLAINEDVHMNAQLFRRARKIVFYDTPKYLMYERAGSATTGTAKEKIHRDSILAAEKMLDLFLGSSSEAAAAERLAVALIQFYRYQIFTGIRASHENRRSTAGKINKALLLCPDLNKRTKWNWVFMQKLPHLYKFVYTVYDKVRTPNWDV